LSGWENREMDGPERRSEREASESINFQSAFADFRLAIEHLAAWMNHEAEAQR